MEKIIFACDIDNTLIYSKKHPHEGWPCVEWIHEKEQAFMSPKTCELLHELCSRVLFVPVTSRSVEQYRRIRWPEGTEPRMAITTHGARLLTGDGEDESWRQDTEALIRPWLAELHRMEMLLAPDPSFIRCRMVDDTYLFVYCAPGVDAAAMGEKLRGLTNLTVCVGGKKIYLLPHGLHKGTAMARLRLRYPGHQIIAAGDSEMDLDMLNAADRALYPQGLQTLVKTPGISCPANVLFSEYLLSQV